MNFAMDVVVVTYIRKTRNLHKKAKESLEVQKIVVPLHPQSRNNDSKSTVPWMSGLVSGLQNRVRRFESARNLQEEGSLGEWLKPPVC